MGILRTDVVSHSQLEGSGSVEFDGVGDYLTFGSHSAFSPATADITIEFWFYLTDGTNLSSGNYYFCDMGSNGYRFQIYNGGLYWAVDPNDYVGPINNVLSNNTWHHIAGVRDGNALELYLDGVHLGTKITTASVTSTTFTIGSYSTGGGDYEPYGYISNFRYVRGVVYKNNFTPPKFELKNIPGTIVLGCQSTTSATDFAVTPSTVTANGDAAASAFHPGLKKDITDTGVVFDGVTTFDSQAYFVPPSGKTSERNRGRGLWGGGWNSPSTSSTNNIDFIQIQSGGIAKDFGDLIAGGNQIRGVSSSTRGVFLGGRRPHPGVVNTMDFVTIATTANALDFGDLLTGRAAVGEISSQTRGIAAAGYNPGNTNVIEFITIATLGNSQDFGDTLSVGSAMAGTQSSTRGILAGNYTPSSPNTSNVIQFLTIATTGNTQDFGDLTDSRHSPSGTSNGVRAVIAAGTHLSPGNNNTMDFVTIASTGNATDFGDLLTVSTGSLGATSDKIRGVFGGGSNSPLYHDNIQQVIISTTGNSVDIGDLTLERLQAGCVSDAHGGLE